MLLLSGRPISSRDELIVVVEDREKTYAGTIMALKPMFHSKWGTCIAQGSKGRDQTDELGILLGHGRSGVC